MTKKRIISVIIPTRNRRELLAEALRSVVAQTGPWRLDIVVIDDGSTDDSEQVVRRFWGVRYLWRTREGIAAARNHGVRIARGQWLAFLGPDDHWAAGKLQRQLAATSGRGGLEAVYGLVQDFSEPTAAQHRRRGFDAPEPARVSAPAPAADRRLGCLLIRRRSFLRVGGFDTGRRIDSERDWVLRCRAAGLREALVPHVVLHRRVPAASELQAPRPPYLRAADEATRQHRSTA